MSDETNANMCPDMAFWLECLPPNAWLPNKQWHQHRSHAFSPANTDSCSSLSMAFSLLNRSIKAVGVNTSFSYCSRHSLQVGTKSVELAIRIHHW